MKQALPPKSRLDAARRARRNGVVVLALFFGTAAAAVIVARLYHVGVASTVVGALLGGGAPAGLYVAWVTYWQGQEAQDLTLPEVADLLAVAVGEQWQREVLVWRLNDPFPLDVSWEPADPSLMENWDELVKLASSAVGWPRKATWASHAAELAGSGGDLASVLARVPTGRLVVLGERGAGKTMLMVRLVLDLLTARVDGPVPVLISLASWNPDESGLFDWLATRLMIDYPALAQRAAGGKLSRAQVLLNARLILPILDGLDEVPDKARGTAITAINEALQIGVRLVLTCRTESYSDTVHARFGAEATLQAAAIELHPLAASTVAQYLLADAPGRMAKQRWEPVVAILGTKAPAAQALTTPLMVGLARIIYNYSEAGRGQPNPSELLNPRLSERKAVERHLLDAYLRAAYRPAQGATPRWTAVDAERYLVFLARRLKRGATDIAWWNLADTAPRHLVGLALGLLVGLAGAAGYPYVGMGVGLLVGVAVGLAVRRNISIDMTKTNISHGLLGGVLGGTAAALLTLAILGPGTRGSIISSILAAGLALGFGLASMRNFWTSLAAAFAGSMAVDLYEHAPVFYGARTAVGPWLHLLNGLGLMLAALLFVELADLTRNVPARRLAVNPVWLALGISCGAILGLEILIQTGWAQGLIVGVVAAMVGAVGGSMGDMVATDLTLPADPKKILSRDRLAFLVAWLGLGLAFGISAAFASSVSQSIGSQPTSIHTAIQIGLANVVVFGLPAGFVQARWGSLTLARCWLAITRRLPWSYMSFLEDAHQRGVLRQEGAAYQFRHGELQQRLAAKEAITEVERLRSTAAGDRG